MTEQLVKEKEQIIRDFGIDIEEVEPTVYKVLNTDKEFNIDKLQWALEECIVVSSVDKHHVKEENGVYTKVANIYYIVIERNVDLAYKYYDKAVENFGDVLYLSYNYNPSNIQHIDTLYYGNEL